MRARLLACSIVLALLPGCGTLLGTALTGPTPYVGVILDGGLLVDGGFGVSASCGCTGRGERASKVRARLFAALDLPFSLAVDTALLPISLPWWVLSAVGRS